MQMQQQPDVGAMPSEVSGTLQSIEQGGAPQGSQLPQSASLTAGQLQLAICLMTAAPSVHQGDSLLLLQLLLPVHLWDSLLQLQLSSWAMLWLSQAMFH